MLSHGKEKPVRNRKGKNRFGCGVSFVISVSCGVAGVDSEARGTAPSEVMFHWVCFWVRGKQGVGGRALLMNLKIRLKVLYL